MKQVFAVLMATASIVTAGVASGTSHYDDASTMSSLMSGDFRSSSYEVSITYKAGVGYNYHVLFDGSYSDSDATNKYLAAVTACALVSGTTSWSSEYLIVTFMDGAFQISTANARYAFDHIDSMGGQWTLDYVMDHTTLI